MSFKSGCSCITSKSGSVQPQWERSGGLHRLRCGKRDHLLLSLQKTGSHTLMDWCTTHDRSLQLSLHTVSLANWSHSERLWDNDAVVFCFLGFEDDLSGRLGSESQSVFKWKAARCWIKPSVCPCRLTHDLKARSLRVIQSSNSDALCFRARPEADSFLQRSFSGFPVSQWLGSRVQLQLVWISALHCCS